MNLRLETSRWAEDGIFSALLDPTGKLIAIVLEHAYQVGPGQFLPKVAAGTYTCTRYDSPEHGYQVFVLNDVPPFQGQPVTFIEMHIGNYQRDSKGCLILGQAIAVVNGQRMVTKSKDTFDAFMASMTGIDSFQLTVVR